MLRFSDGGVYRKNANTPSSEKRMSSPTILRPTPVDLYHDEIFESREKSLLLFFPKPKNSEKKKGVSLVPNFHLFFQYITIFLRKKNLHE